MNKTLREQAVENGLRVDLCFRLCSLQRAIKRGWALCMQVDQQHHLDLIRLTVGSKQQNKSIGGVDLSDHEVFRCLCLRIFHCDMVPADKHDLTPLPAKFWLLSSHSFFFFHYSLAYLVSM